MQLLDANGQVVAQRDRWPGDGLFPTAALQAGQVITDNLAIPLDVPPGQYRLIAGLYRGDVEGYPAPGRPWRRLRRAGPHRAARRAMSSSLTSPPTPSSKLRSWSDQWLPLLLALLLTAPALRPLWQPGLQQTDDGMHHLFRFFNLDLTIQAGHWGRACWPTRASATAFPCSTSTRR